MSRHKPSTASIVICLVLFSACGSQHARTTPQSEVASGVSTDRTAWRSLGADRRLRAGFLVVDGVYNTELTAPYDVLEHARHHLSADLGLEVFTVAPGAGHVTTAEGLKILPDYSFADAPPIDILVVPSAMGSRAEDLQDTSLINWVATVGASSELVLSLCWGAFLLAQAGLLDDRACTTFPGDFDTFAGRFPDHDLRVNVSLVHDGKFVTSQGGVRSFDAAMYVIELLYGTDLAHTVGEGLLIPWPPPSHDFGLRFHVVAGSR